MKLLFFLLKIDEVRNKKSHPKKNLFEKKFLRAEGGTCTENNFF